MTSLFNLIDYWSVKLRTHKVPNSIRWDFTSFHRRATFLISSEVMRSGWFLNSFRCHKEALWKFVKIKYTIQHVWITRKTKTIWPMNRSHDHHPSLAVRHISRWSRWSIHIVESCCNVIFVVKCQCCIFGLHFESWHLVYMDEMIQSPREMFCCWHDFVSWLLIEIIDIYSRLCLCYM